jgi:signal transduction histidine kinase
MDYRARFSLWHNRSRDSILTPTAPVPGQTGEDTQDSERWYNRFIRPQDVVWLVLFSALALVSPHQTAAEIEMLSALALIQVLGPRFPALNTPKGNIVSITLKLILGYLLIGVTGGITSSYYVILLVPVVSAATTLSPLGTVLVTLLACTGYLSFFAFVPQLELHDLREFTLRVIFLPVVGFLTRQMAETNRREVARHRQVANQLAQANQDLQIAQDAVRRSDRLAALGQLTAGLAHELRNPLGTIKASSEMLTKNLPKGDELALELAGFISTEVDRTNSLITRFLQFARPLVLKRQTADISETIDAAVTQVERHNPPFQISIFRNYSPDIPPLPLDTELMERVIYNLLVNACQASPPGAAVTVKTRRLDGIAEIAVIDRGSGIEPKNLESIFNPFFTTKPEGVGLGLAIVAKIIDEHGGTITVESETGRGSVFRVHLPLAAGGAELNPENFANNPGLRAS